MLRYSLLPVLLLASLTLAQPTPPAERRVQGERLAALPDREGFAGAFAGVSHGTLLVAGGANFPDRKPWEGGKKLWYDTVFALDKPDGRWKAVGTMPRPLGYGACVSHRDGVICVGGSDAERHHASVFRLEWKAGRLMTTDLPALPRPLANTAGALVGDTLYVAGGIDTPDAKTARANVYRLDLAAAEPKWSEIDPCPGGGRMLATAASLDGAFYLVGGVELVEGVRRYRKDAFRYDPKQGWKRLADLPTPLAAGPSPAPTDAAGFYLIGGDDGSQVAFQPPERHPGFRTTLLRFDAGKDTWRTAGELPVARVTLPLVVWNGRWILPSGEVRPGVRSPEVWSLVPPLP